jgi:hypothetical protein
VALCKRCDVVKATTKFWYEELVKDSGGKGRIIAHEICLPCDGELVARIKATVMQIDSKAMRQGLLAKLKT